MLSTFYRTIAQELSNDNRTVFLHNDLTFEVFLNSHNEYEYDIYEELGVESTDGGIFSDYTAEQVIETLLDEH